MFFKKNLRKDTPDTIKLLYLENNNYFNEDKFHNSIFLFDGGIGTGKTTKIENIKEQIKSGKFPRDKILMFSLETDSINHSLSYTLIAKKHKWLYNIFLSFLLLLILFIIPFIIPSFIPEIIKYDLKSIIENLFFNLKNLFLIIIILSGSYFLRHLIYNYSMIFNDKSISIFNSIYIKNLTKRSFFKRKVYVIEDFDRIDNELINDSILALSKISSILKEKKDGKILKKPKFVITGESKTLSEKVNATKVNSTSVPPHTFEDFCNKYSVELIKVYPTPGLSNYIEFNNKEEVDIISKFIGKIFYEKILENGSDNKMIIDFLEFIFSFNSLNYRSAEYIMNVIFNTKSNDPFSTNLYNVFMEPLGFDYNKLTLRLPRHNKYLNDIFRFGINNNDLYCLFINNEKFTNYYKSIGRFDFEITEMRFNYTFLYLIFNNIMLLDGENTMYDQDIPLILFHKESEMFKKYQNEIYNHLINKNHSYFISNQYLDSLKEFYNHDIFHKNKIDIVDNYLNNNHIADSNNWYSLIKIITEYSHIDDNELYDSICYYSSFVVLLQSYIGNTSTLHNIKHPEKSLKK